MTVIVAILCLIANFAACTDDDRMVEVVDEIESNDYHVSLDEALATADRFLSGLESETTRSGEARRVKSASLITLVPRTRSASDAVDGSFYLVNYEDERGFALLSADRRMLPIYAFSDTGSLYMQDTIDNKPLALFFENLKYKAATASSNPSTYIFDGRKYITGAQVSPLLSMGARRWGQLAPYNDSCPLIRNENGELMNAPVGCTAVSVAQIMSYYKWPKSAGKTHFLWRSMNRGQSYNKVAFLMAWLGRKELLNINYNDESSATMAGVKRAFMGMGYKAPDDYKDFDEAKAITILTNAKAVSPKISGSGPLLISSITINDQTKQGDGHSWVIDGYAKYVVDDTDLTPKLNQNYTYFHCVWGNTGGTANGYFYMLSSNSIGDSMPGAINNNDYYTGLQTNVKVYVQKQMKYMTNFVPDK